MSIFVVCTRVQSCVVFDVDSVKWFLKPMESLPEFGMLFLFYSIILLKEEMFIFPKFCDIETNEYTTY
jgi:hypothetical protein